MELYIPASFEVLRDQTRCIQCRLCQEQCANGVHLFSEKLGKMVSEEWKCVDCQRCVSFCPTHALAIRKSQNAFRENSNWKESTMLEIYKQANSGGVLLSSMGSPKEIPV